MGWRIAGDAFGIEVCAMVGRGHEEFRAHVAGTRCSMSKGVAVSTLGVDIGIVFTQNR